MSDKTDNLVERLTQGILDAIGVCKIGSSLEDQTEAAMAVVKPVIEALTAANAELVARLEQVEGTAAKLANRSATVMLALRAHGGSIVPHLLDTDENAGQRLWDAINATLEALFPQPKEGE